jgi:hypothetical protein
MARVTQISARTNQADPEMAADELLRHLDGAPPRLVVLFAPCDYDHHGLHRAMRARLPRETRLVGAGTGSTLDNNGFHPGSVVMAALGGDLEVGIGLGKDLAGDAASAGAAAVSRALSELGVKGEDLDPKRHVGLIIEDGHKFKKEELLLGVLPEAPALTLVGGGAANNNMGASGLVSLDGETTDNAVLILVARTRAPWAALRHHSYRPTGERLTITKIDPTCQMALEIDGKPAAQAYADRIGVGIDDLEFGKPHGFADRPTAMRVGREYFIRAPWKPLPDGSILFSNMLREGTELELMKMGNMSEMLGEFFRDELPARVASPSATLVFNCSGRHWTAMGLGQVEAITQELAKAPPIVGMNCAFELYNGFQINSTLTALSFGENDA